VISDRIEALDRYRFESYNKLE